MLVLFVFPFFFMHKADASFAGSAIFAAVVDPVAGAVAAILVFAVAFDCRAVASVVAAAG